MYEGSIFWENTRERLAYHFGIVLRITARSRPLGRIMGAFAYLRFGKDLVSWCLFYFAENRIGVLVHSFKFDSIFSLAEAL